MYTHLRPSVGPPGRARGVVVAEAGGNCLTPCLLVSAKGPSLPSSLPSGIVCHQGLELKQETRCGLKKKEAGGGFFFFFFPFYTIL